MKRSRLLLTVTLLLAAVGPVWTASLDERPQRHLRTEYVWPYTTGPSYGSVPERAGDGTPRFRTTVGEFDLTRGAGGIPEELTTARTDAQYFVIQLDTKRIGDGVLIDVTSTIEGNGGVVVQRAPEAALIVRLGVKALAALEGQPADWLAIEPYHAAYKLHPAIGRTPLRDPLRATSEVYDLDIRLFPGEDAAAVAKHVERLGGQVAAVYPDTVRAELQRDRLAQLAQLQAVVQVFEHLPAYAQGEETTTTMQTGRYNQGATPYHDAGVDGGGDGVASPQVLMVLDSGIQLDAGDLSDTRVSPGTPGPAHRKVRSYETVVPFGGDGDLLGCDAGPSGGYTHGHVVAVTALGNATAVDPVQYGESWSVTGDRGAVWRLDGVAPGAVLVAYDAQPTPVVGACGDPLQGALTPGDLYSGGSSGSLGDAYANDARVFNFSWGRAGNTYDVDAQDIDQFLTDKGDAMVFVAVGNDGLDADNDGFSDKETMGSPATSKNGLAIGASRAANDFGEGGQEEERAFFNGTGPAPGNRIAPQLMAPGDEDGGGDSGLSSEFACRTFDNDSNGPVSCDLISGLEGTSYATAAASGAALLVRDYFAQGFYPDGTSGNPGNDADRVSQLSGALVKATLIASAHFLTGDKPPKFTGHIPGGDGLRVEYRFNYEQGYGRIQLDNALPLQSWPASVTALRVADGGIPGGVQHLPGLDGTIDTTTGETDSTTFSVCRDQEELRVALVWTDPVTLDGSLISDLDLELVSPTGVTYHGNYFTDDDDRSWNPWAPASDPVTEDCPGIDGSVGEYDASAWSLPACMRGDGTTSPHDHANPTEGVFLSPDPYGDGTFGQIEIGSWTLRVIGASGMESGQRYAVAIAGGLCTSSWVRFDRTTYSCNQTAVAQVLELSEPGDLNPDAATIGSRSTLEVVDGSGTVLDEELLSFLAPLSPLEFRSFGVPLTAGTARDPGNGVLDVRDGDTIRIVYQDVGSDGMPDPDRRRVGTAAVDCTPQIAAGGLVVEQYGRDLNYRVHGGCERNARDQFSFGFPDRYLDAGELLDLEYAFAYHEALDLIDASIDLRCVLPDADSPADCAPGMSDCADPDRANNASCDQRPSGQPGDTTLMTILDTPQYFGLIPSNAAVSIHFGVKMADAIAGSPEVEMILSIEGAAIGKTRAAQVVTRHRLDADELSLFYSTDFPTGGVEQFDQSQQRAGDEILENPTTDSGDFQEDYRFETRTWSDLTAGGTRNFGLLSPWNFDANDGGFRSGILATTDDDQIAGVIAQWGEDKNFNNVNDKVCSLDVTTACQRGSDCDFATQGICQSLEDRDEVGNGILDKSWNTRGGCGWQTKDPGQETGGIWHTGRIGSTIGDCLVVGGSSGQCQAYEIIGGTGGQLAWREALVTPTIQRVNGSDYQVEIVDWAWNQAIDLADSNTAITWELDTDVTRLEPVDLYSDNTVLNSLFGPYGATGAASNNPDLTNGFSMFAPLDQTGASWNGVLGNNRSAKNSCWFENGSVNVAQVCPGCPTVSGDLGFAGPLDNDLDDDADGMIDEYVTSNGPVRNMDLYAVNGPDMRRDVLEDLYGETGEFFQAAIGIWNFERNPTQTENKVSYGIGLDDMVIQWREFTLTDDSTSCDPGECAVVFMQSDVLYQTNSTVGVSVIDRSPAPANDCDLDGTPDATTDCNGNGTPDVVVLATTEAEPQGEILIADQTADPAVYRGEIPISSRFDAPGILFVTPTGVFVRPGYLKTQILPTITVTYVDTDDGSGAPCDNGSDASQPGSVTATSEVNLRQGGDLRVVSVELSDNGDSDAFADGNETVMMRLRIVNKGEDASDVTASISTSDPKIDCVPQPIIHIGDVAAEEELSTSAAFVFRVADIDRTGSGLTDLDEFSASFNIMFTSNQFDANSSVQEITIDLDLDAVGGACNDPQGCRFFEGWEGLSNVNCNEQGGQACLGWQAVNIDAGLTTAESVEGYRCQYSDPDWVNSRAYAGGITDCFLGTNQAQADQYWWHINTPADPNLGKAYSGLNSLHMGEIRSFDTITTPVAVLEWLETRDPINLAAAMPAPILSFKQQVDFIDDRTINVATGRSPSRGIVQAQLADPAGDPVGDWIKLHPYVNRYRTQAQDQYFNCSFDPIDDGNDEDSFFDPTDPDRLLGPSSTCSPEFAFVYQGDSFYPFSVDNLARAEGPALEGSLGLGTWVEPRFDLSRFRGRSVRLRFLYTDLDTGFGGAGTWEDLFTFNPSPGDDGWWIDDVEITNTLDEPATIVNDDKDNSLLPACDDSCTFVEAALAADPVTPLPAPGQLVELSAEGSFADVCAQGILQARFWEDGNGDGLGGDAQDRVVRSWSESPILLRTPDATTTYVAEVRCSSDPSCVGSASVEVVVTCPSSGKLSFPTVLATAGSTLDWGQSTAYDYALGRLLNLPGYVTDESGQNAGPSSSFDISAESPLPGEGYWYVFRQPGALGSQATGFCNAGGVSWGNPSRDGSLP